MEPATPALRIPFATLALLALAAAVHAMPGAAEALVFDRAAIAGGEAWRVVTGNLVHFSTPHLLLDAATIALAGTLLELRRPGIALAVYPAAALAIGASLWVFEPGLGRFAGLSGVACASAAALAGEWIRARGVLRAGGALLLATLFARLVLDRAGGSGALAVPPVPLAHAAGIVAGVACVLAARLAGTAGERRGRANVTRVPLAARSDRAA